MAKSNIYEAGTADVLQLFGDYFQGGPGLVALALASTALDDASRNAVDRSLESFGYGSGACTFASILPMDQQVEGGDVKLDAQSLFMLVEALDPLVLVVADEASARLVAQAYRTGFDLDSPARVFGRPAVIFRSLPDLMQADEGKQRAWKLLKSLPKRPR